MVGPGGERIKLEALVGHLLGHVYVQVNFDYTKKFKCNYPIGA